MEALAAISLAGNILQFVDFARNVLIGARELYHSKSGSLNGHHEIQLVTADLESLVARLSVSFRVTSEYGPLYQFEQKEQEDFEIICKGTREVAQELLKKLRSLRVEYEGKKLDSLKLSWRVLWSEDDIKSLVQRLENYKDALETRVLFSIRSHQSFIAINSF